MNKLIKILVVDDDDNILFAFKEVFKKEGYTTITASNGLDALNRIETESPTIVFMDITMPLLDGLETLESIRKQNPWLPVIIITGYSTMQAAIKAMQLGAFEYLTKPLNIEKIREVAKRAISSIRSDVTPSEKGIFYNTFIKDRYEIVGNSQLMLEIYKIIGSISMTPNHTSVIITGESGTGKELVARAIHSNSSNTDESFIAINCTVLPENLLESELFGYEKGAFTGASERKLGKFEIAGKGTIFLDEIGILSQHLQQKLLRVIQEREFERLGGNIPIKVNARFIAATNLDIKSEITKGNFREDLFYRLNIASIQMPPLRERKEDILILSYYFLSKYNSQIKKTIKGFSDKAIEILQNYSFPGNVRELENTIERAVMLSNGEIIMPEVLFELSQVKSTNLKSFPMISSVFSESREYIIESFERQFILEKLKKFHGNVTNAAKDSSMTRQNFQRLLNKYNIKAEEFRN